MSWLYDPWLSWLNGPLLSEPYGPPGKRTGLSLPMFGLEFQFWLSLKLSGFGWLKFWIGGAVDGIDLIGSFEDMEASGKSPKDLGCVWLTTTSAGAAEAAGGLAAVDWIEACTSASRSVAEDMCFDKSMLGADLTTSGVGVGVTTLVVSSRDFFTISISWRI